jgi:hypothetical protein
VTEDLDPDAPDGHPGETYAIWIGDERGVVVADRAERLA